MPTQLWGLMALQCTDSSRETIHPPSMGQKFLFLLSVKLRICKISFFILLMEKENNRKVIVCFI